MTLLSAEDSSRAFRSKGLPKILGSARVIATPARPSSLSARERFWVSTAQEASRAQSTPRSVPVAASQQLERRCSTAPSTTCDRAGMMQILHWVERELEIQGLSNSEPSLDRVRIFSTAFSDVIDMLPSYRPFLISVQKEYDALISRLQVEIDAAAPLEGRMKTLKAESLSFVGESMTWFQMEIDRLRKSLAAATTELERLSAENSHLTETNARLQKESEKDKEKVLESHTQNCDILKYLERLEKQVEQMRRQELYFQSEHKIKEQKIKEKDARIATVEEQLNTERTTNANMVPREEHETFREEVRHIEVRNKELEELYAAKQKDYLAIVDAYSKTAGQSIAAGDEVRPLTPRPAWRHCKGLIDPGMPHTVDKADIGQDLLQRIFVNARNLLSAYGLATACQKSSVFQRFARQGLGAPLAVADVDAIAVPGNFRKDTEERDVADVPAVSPRQGDGWLGADIDQRTPEIFRHATRIKNLRFSRKKTSDIIEHVIALRSRQGTQTQSFTESMLEHLSGAGELQGEDPRDFAVNVYASVRCYSAEPDFLAYLLLIAGRVSDRVVQDNRSLCAELLKIFSNHFESETGGKTITKQKLFYGLQEVLPNKEKEMWQGLVTYLPAGGPDVQVNYEWLLVDDPYVLSPIVYALRLQHLEESLAFTERLEKTIRKCVKDGAKAVKYDALKLAFRDDPDFSLMQAEDYAKAFSVPVQSLKPNTENDVDALVELMKHGDMYHVLFFPQFPNDDADLGFQDGM